MNVSIIVIGDELLIGQVTDTNSGFLARTMRPAGWTVVDVDVVPDDNSRIRNAVLEALDRADVVLTTGGLGPTKDDITKQALMDVFGGELYRNAEVEANVREVVGKGAYVSTRLPPTRLLCQRRAVLYRTGSAQPR